MLSAPSDSERASPGTSDSVDITSEPSDLQLHDKGVSSLLLCPALGGHFGIARSVRRSVPWRSCLGYRHVGCLQLSHRRPPVHVWGASHRILSQVGAWRPAGVFFATKFNISSPKFLPPSNCLRRGAYRLAPPRAIPC